MILTGLLIASLTLSAVPLVSLWRAPVGAALVERGPDGLDRVLARELVRHATPAQVAARLDALLAEAPRNWLAIEAVEEIAAERALPLPDDLIAQREAAWEQDSGLWLGATKCARCMWSAAECELSALLICRAPVDLTPVGDIAGVIRGGSNYALGREVDQVEVILSAIGLGAVGLALVTGGSSLTIKAGAGFAKTAKSMNRLPEALTTPLTRAFREGVDWARIGSVRTADDLTRLMRPEVLRPAVAILDDTGRLTRNTSVLAGLHLMKHVDSPKDMAALARASDALGPRTVGTLEILGKSRVLRATMRLADEVWSLVAGLAGMLAALVGLFWSALTSAVLRRLRRAARDPHRA